MFKHLFLLFLLFNILKAFESGFGEDYYKIKDTKVKKTAFINILLPKIKKAEKRILSERNFIKLFFKKYIFSSSHVSRSELVRLINISKKYRIKHIYDESKYLEKIDAIPVSMVLAQSAVESAWGNSRFAKDGNNLFGEWTWGKKGIIPEGRDENATHKLRIFDSLDDSISQYMLNLNRHNSYEDFRKLRASYRSTGKKLTGIDASRTMTNYSQMREKYNSLLAKVIKSNDFLKYDFD